MAADDHLPKHIIASLTTLELEWRRSVWRLVKIHVLNMLTVFPLNPLKLQAIKRTEEDNLEILACICEVFFKGFLVSYSFI